MQPMGQELASLEAQMGPPSWPDLPATAQAAPPAPETAHQPPAAAAAVPANNDASAPEQPSVPLAAQDEDDDSSSSEMEDDIWDADGFVRLEFCIGAAFEEEDGNIICTMCKYAFSAYSVASCAGDFSSHESTF